MTQGEIKDGGDTEIALRRGIAQFNAGQFFEAHEIWEDWWRATTSPEKQTIQGMIQIAVAMHHAGTGNRTGAISVMERAIRNLGWEDETWHGIKLAELVRDSRTALEQLRSGQPVTSFTISVE